MTQTIHLTAVGGTGMGTLACMLKDSGYSITGSDRNIYPPMSDQLRDHDIRVFEGYDPKNLDHDPDLVIIGNVVTRQNPEAAAVMERGLPYLSMPQAINRFFAKDKKIILVTGTHGKTTTSSIMAHMLYHAGLDPSFIIGGVLKDFDTGFHIGAGEYLVIEGDEYDTAFFDKESKFLHYDPAITILTGIEFDHADIFNDLDHIKQSFIKLMHKLSPDSLLVASSVCETAAEVIPASESRLVRYGNEGFTCSGYRVEQQESRFAIFDHGQTCCEVRTGLQGEHNASNILACVAAAREIGLSSEAIEAALSDFSGIKRRQEIRGVKQGITVMDDFAHHPSAVKETIAAVKPFYSNGRVIAVFEPRTNTSMRRIFQDVYPAAFAEADLVCIAKPTMMSKIPEKERVDPQKLVNDIRQNGNEARFFENTDAIVEFLRIESRQNDLILIMSNGGFDNIHQRILEVLC
ncbi:MAG: UDP-N-acetylmuramate:L-alanyl-gamma-D-glutamyl-meso-diaminopimelate ligase [Desulfobacteraceae bacterium]|nr:MAG: UDP-N-acetylmuramate:L-alanyl-gamma-D-glutamyl-meso-diaminopimelate ligase [Desulfobacteraceae bacterium]